VNRQVLLTLSRPSLLNMVDALKSGRLHPPYSRVKLASYVPDVLAAEVATELERLDSNGMESAHIAYTMSLLAAQRSEVQQTKDRVELVWTAKETVKISGRTTNVVVRELLASACKSVLVCTYAIDRSEKARAVFAGLAERMNLIPGLQVDLFINIKRPYKSENTESELLREFAEEFRKHIWSGEHLPRVYYYPSSLEIGGMERTCLHSKCIVIDNSKILVTSANFTEAAHERNIETGVLFHDESLSQTVRDQFVALVQQRVFLPVPGLP
jgi:phosphatidylserine/phosphatidylglycerophosphate/cardiolipin synthase-like enzyme